MISIEAIAVACIAAIPPTIAAILGYKKIHHQFNARMDEYIRLVGDAREAKGRLDEKTEQAGKEHPS